MKLKDLIRLPTTEYFPPKRIGLILEKKAISVAGDSLNPANKPSFPRSNSKKIDEYNGFEIYGSLEKPGYEVYGIQENRNVLAYVIIEEKELQHKTHRLREVWVDKNQKGKNLAITLLHYILKVLHLKLLIDKDEPFTKYGRAFILKCIEKDFLHGINFDGTKRDKQEVISQLSQDDENDYELLLGENLIKHGIHDGFVYSRIWFDETTIRLD